MRRAILCSAAILLIALGFASARAEAAATWHSEQPVGAGGFSPSLGEVGDIECWEANRCMLITAGNAGVPAGLFAYDGSSWYRYATVCGGTAGRIAWAGPDEFWTISDQQPGHAAAPTESATQNISLCHFKDGRVVGSYAEPVLSSTPYQHLKAAACGGLSDCWFGGAVLPAAAVNPGAFHLHWDGSSVTAVPSPTVPSASPDPVREVTGLAYHQGTFFEGVKVQGRDVPTEEEEEKEPTLGPSFLHAIEPGGVFKPLFGPEPIDYESGEGGSGEAEATELEGFRLTGSDEEPLWAISGSSGSSATLTVLQVGEEDQVSQLPLSTPGVEGAPILAPGVRVTGAAAEPGREAAWIAFKPQSAGQSSAALVARIGAGGAIEPELTLPAPGEEVEGEELGRKGPAGPIACAAAEQCWLATGTGWLFHLGSNPTPNDDPAMHVLVTSRPLDDSVPVLPPLELPEDDSGAGQKGTSSQIEIEGGPEPLPHRLPPLYSNVKQKLIDGSVLELSFTLHKRARVQLVAKRKGRVVAESKRYTMAKGRRSIRLRLDPKRWPTKLDLRIKSMGKGSK